LVRNPKKEKVSVVGFSGLDVSDPTTKIGSGTKEKLEKFYGTEQKSAVDPTLRDS